MLSELKVNGPVYQRIVQGKDLIADILPPPKFIIESYLVALQALAAPPDERAALIEKLKFLQREYDRRHAFWEKENLDVQLKERILHSAHQPAQEFYQIAFSQFVPALQQDDMVAATAALETMGQRYAVHRSAINKLVDIAIVHNVVDEADAKIEIETSTWIMFAILVSATGLVALVLLGISRNLARQLGCEPSYAVAIAGKIAAGDLAVAVDTGSNDRSSLLFAMKTMRDGLANIVREVRAGTGEIASASHQIANGNLDLSSRTEEQASSLEQTASSIEEFASTVQQNADHAQQANLLAVSASAIAVRGGAVVSQVVDTMGAINASSRKIVDIIGVIDSLAFQTNILALNAAVEAARAGEEGRGFAVVAAEVRNLAQRSASAAKEIKSLISESVEKVDIGTRLVDEAGATMGDIVGSIRQVTDIIAEITSASREQTLGIEQINQAIMQMDNVTQQNAALVEEAAASAESLEEQAGNLSQLVSIFKLGHDHLPVRSAKLSQRAVGLVSI